ncbi:MAG: HAMP domain-containing histidine kinase [Myxococcota bacterium]|nr:HAMP domain-containing histidine kinase [Myxococcota bacterium]
MLISVACLVMGVVAWQQHQEILRIESLLRAEPGLSNSGNSPDSAVSNRRASVILRPCIAIPMALLAVFGGSLLLARGKSLRLEDERGTKESSEIQASNFADAKTADLLAHQRLLARTSERTFAAEFAAKLSHDLRNPLAGIQMSLTNMISETADEDLRERLEVVLSESVRVTDLLGSAIESSRGNPEPLEEVEPAVLVDSLLELLAFHTPAHLTITREIQQGLRFRLPPSQFQHCLASLILNSAEAIGEGEGLIQIEIGMRDDHLRVSVLDSGPGFPEELLLGASRPADAKRRAAPELGLATVRRFAREMGGKLEISNQPPSGISSGGQATILLPSAVHHG